MFNFLTEKCEFIEPNIVEMGVLGGLKLKYKIVCFTGLLQLQEFAATRSS